MADDHLAALQQFADSLPIPFWLARGKQANYSIALWNVAAERVYGYSRQEAVGTSFLKLFVEEFLRDRAAADCDNVISGSFSHPDNVITIDHTKDKSRIVLLTNVFRFKYGSEVYQAELSIDFTGTALDTMIISDYRGLIREAESSPEVRQFTYLLKSRLDREREQVNNWAAGVMHDLRGEAGSARDHLISYRQRVHQSNTDRDIIRLDNLLRSLQFRADAFIGVYGGGLSNPTNATFEGWAVIDDEINRLEEYGPIMFHASIEYEPRPASDQNIQLLGRAEAFRHCVYNLFQNACRHLQAQGGQSFIRVAAKRDAAGQFLELSVLNPGTMELGGSTTDDSADIRISLGLRLMKDVVEEVGGELTHQNRTVNDLPMVRATLRWPVGLDSSFEGRK